MSPLSSFFGNKNLNEKVEVDEEEEAALQEALGDVAARGHVASPALVVVGEVAALAATLSWYGAPPVRWEALRHVA